MNIKELHAELTSDKIFSKDLYKEIEILNVDEINKLIDFVIADNDDEFYAFLYLALYAYSCGDKLPPKVYDYLLENKVYYPAAMYLRANESVAVRLIEAINLLKSENFSDANCILSSLSAIPCDATKEFLLTYYRLFRLSVYSFSINRWYAVIVGTLS